MPNRPGSKNKDKTEDRRRKRLAQSSSDKRIPGIEIKKFVAKYGSK